MGANMAINDLQQEHRNSKIKIAPLGFEADAVEKLEKIFQRERPEQKNYTTVYPYAGESVGLFLINYDNPAAPSEKEVLTSKYPDIPIVAVSQSAITDQSIIHQLHPYQVHGIILAARLLNSLDKVAIHPVVENVSSYQPPVANNQIIAEKVADAPVTPKPESISVAQVRATAPVEAAGYRVLVVDDSLAIQKSLELNLLTLKSISEIDFADSGEIALEKVDVKYYDLIFLDVMMPGIDGYETCTQLRKKPLYKKTPIVMVSAKCSPLDEVKGIVAGCTTYLTKPVQNEAFQKLGHRMMDWLANKKAT
jgi:CheY-like chemotaxis protein